MRTRDGEEGSRAADLSVARRGGRGARAALHAALFGLPALYFAAFFNRFAGLRSGAGEYAGGMLFLRGVLPYRDYFTAGPPLNTLKSALLLKLFGPTLIVSRIAGAGERLVLGGVLFLWLRRRFGEVPAVVASVATVILSAADCTDPLASYNHDAILWAVLSGWLASGLVDWKLSGSGRAGRAVLAGIAVGLAVLTKQTVGLATAAAILLWLVLLLPGLLGGRRAFGAVGLFLLGCVAPVGAVLLALRRLGVLRSMLTMLFVTGPSAKAPHAADFLVRELEVARGNLGWVVLGLAALALAWRPIARAMDGQPDLQAPQPGAAWVLGGGLLVVGVAELLALTTLPALNDITKSAVYFAFPGVLWLLARMVWRVAARGLNGVQGAELLLVTAVSVAVAGSLSLSWPAFEAMLVPGAGLLLAALLRGVRSRRGAWSAYGVVALIVFLSVREKLNRPFLFDGQQELPVRFATKRSRLPAMRGMRLPPSTVGLLDGSMALVSGNTQATDTIFTYPELGLLYVVADRRPPTFAGSHNIDVVSDGLAGAEAERLLAAKPKVVIAYRQTEKELRAAEHLWREGLPSGQRALIAATEQLERGADLAATYRLAPEDEPIEVWIRRERP